MESRISAAIGVVIVGCLIGSAGAQEGVLAPLIQENTTVKVGEHTYVIPDQDARMVPNVGIIVGNRATLVIDPGMGRPNGETVLREVAKLSSNAEIFVASTHYHTEHTTGFLAFPANAQYITSTVQQAEFVELGDAHIRRFASRSPVTGDLLSDATVFEADIEFDGEYMLDLGGVRVRFLAVGPTHTRGDTGIFVEEDSVLFSGDVVMNQSFLAANENSSMAAWLAAFDTFEALGPETIVPAHGAVGDGSIISENRAVMEQISSRARALKAQGVSAEEASATVEAELQALHPDWPRSNGLAPAAHSAYSEAP